jgi:hypothetical protein
MDEQIRQAAVQRDPETEFGAWPKKRTLVIGARTFDDFIRAIRMVSQFEEDVRNLKQKSGRHHGIAYGRPGEQGLYVWYSTHQITIHFGDQPHG